MNQRIIDILKHYAPITLQEMMCVKLMNRKDTKYVVCLDTLEQILQAAKDDYYVQTSAEGNCLADYHTIYLDTPDKQMYTLHETGRKVRQKVRMRTYLDTDETYLEVKKKNNHGRTKKKRIVIPDVESVRANNEADAFLAEKSAYSLAALLPHVENEFKRITLVNKGKTERLTIDLGLRFHNFETGQEATLAQLAIIELKREGQKPSPMKQLLVRMAVREGGFSKYCIGCALTNPALRQNNLKEKIRKIAKY